jgi:hypothetical protein
VGELTTLLSSKNVTPRQRAAQKAG